MEFFEENNFDITQIHDLYKRENKKLLQIDEALKKTEEKIRKQNQELNTLNNIHNKINQCILKRVIDEMWNYK